MTAFDFMAAAFFVMVGVICLMVTVMVVFAVVSEIVKGLGKRRG